MTTVAVLGASGYTGRLVVAECRRQGIAPRLLGRDARRIRERLAADGVGHDDLSVVEVDVTETDQLVDALAGTDLVLTTVGPFGQLGRSVLDAAIRTGTHYVDCTGEQPFIRWAHSERDVPARDAGIVAVPAAGFDFLPGDLLAAVAAEAVGWASEVHVAYTVPSSGGLLGNASTGTRRTVATLLGQPGLALVRGELAEERPGEARRLAWFPRPVGPRHAAGIPGGEPITVPRHVGSATTVRSYLALPSWKAELVQMGGSLARWAPARRFMSDVLSRGARGSDGPAPERRRATRWGCVAEAGGRGAVARAWAYGHDLYGLTAVTMVATAQTILEASPPPGVRSPAMLAPPADQLDRLADRCDLRWSVARPESRDPDGHDVPS